ncbi:glycosyltransferase [Micromonospora sp. NPDC050397]|uniref:glycosyltransferase n=1 Tax=Micromonospora sp. NPDC050397 TaxID=3364279 RepID=UPI00384ED983
MRILLTSQPIYSHLVPALVPLARAARALGHTSAVATAASMADELARHDVPLLPLPNVAGQERLRYDPRLAEEFGLPQRLMLPWRRAVDPVAADQIARAYAGPIALRFARDLLEVAADWKPDVIVHEPAEYGGYLVAEALGIPHVTLDISPYAMRELPLVGDVLDAQREALGLPPVGQPLHPHRYLRAGLLPRAWYPAELRLPTGRYYREPAPRDDVPLDPVVAALPADRPVVLASLGSLVLTLPGMAELLPPLVAALGALPCHAVVSLGGQPGLAEVVGPPPPNVHLTPFVAQRTLLTAVDLFVTHAGFGATREAVAAGVPVVALPVFADQPANADRIAELGLGVRLDVAELTESALVEACTRVLADPGFRWRSRAMQRRHLGSPGFEQLVADLAELATRH